MSHQDHVCSRENFETSCLNQVCDCVLTDSSDPEVWKASGIYSSSYPGAGVSCRCLLSEALFKIQGIFVWLVIRSWISFVIASAIAHSEGGEFHCSETNPRALLLVSMFFPSVHFHRYMKYIRRNRAIICFLLAFFPTLVPMGAEKYMGKFPCWVFYLLILRERILCLLNVLGHATS